MSLISNYEYIRDWANARFLKKTDQIQIDLSNYVEKSDITNFTTYDYVAEYVTSRVNYEINNLVYNRIFKGTCNTSAATSTKQVVPSHSYNQLYTGDIVFVTFTYTNTAASPSLNVASTGAKSIRVMINGELTTLPNPGILCANETLQFQYDGTYWVLMNANIDTDTKPGTLSTTSTSALSTSSSEALSGSISLHKISKTGSYDDLNNKPTIPSTTTSVTSGSSAALTSGGAYTALSAKENTSNKVTSISASSTDTQYPSAKAVYTQIGDIESVLNEIITPTPQISVADTLSVESFYDAEASTALSGTTTFRVYGDYLTGNVSMTKSGTDAAMFTLTPTSVTKANALAGYDVTLKYTPTAIGTHTMTITFTSSGATSKTMTVTGTATQYTN